MRRSEFSDSHLDTLSRRGCAGLSDFHAYSTRRSRSMSTWTWRKMWCRRVGHLAKIRRQKSDGGRRTARSLGVMTGQRNIAVSRYKVYGFGLCSFSPCASLSLSPSHSCISKDTDGATRGGSLTACVYRQLYLARAIASLAERQTVRRSERAEPAWCGKAPASATAATAASP